jgi:hypothetical protein
MRVLAAMTLLFAVSCTFDYGPLRGTAGQGEGGVGDEAGARDGREAMVDRPLLTDGTADTDADIMADADIGADATGAVDVSVDSPGIGGEDAAPEEDASAGGAGGTGSTETGGAGGSAGTGGASATGGIVSSGGRGGVGGVTGLGGTTVSTSTAGTGGKGGTAGTGGRGGTTTGGVGGTSVDGGVDAAVVDASITSDATEADGDLGDATGDALFCTPGQTTCVGNASCSCNMAGTDCETIIQDCGSTMSCSPSLGGCVFVDTVPFTPSDTGFSKNSASNVMKLTFYAVSAPRTLLRIEQYMTPLAGAALHWIIYRSAIKESTYNFVTTFPGTATTSTDGYQASPTLNFALETGYYYAIGVWWESSATSYSYHSATATFPIALSSGALSVTSGLSPSLSTTTTPPTAPTSVTWTTPSSLYYPQRLTTR